MPKRKAAAQASAEPETPDYAKMTLPQLKQALAEKKLPVSGKKAELVSRLEGAASSAAATDTSAPPAKKAKKEPKKKAVKAEPEAKPESAASKAVASLKSVTDGAAKKKKKRSPKVDPQVFGSWEVVDDFACMLNQTNIGHNNNKYYVIQLLKSTGGFVVRYNVFTRWGRVGERGDQKYLGPFSGLDDAEKEFCKKFSSKTSNQWKNREKFVPKAGKYTMLEMEEDSDDDQAGRLASMDQTDGPIATKKTAACKLDDSTQKLIKFIFDEDMFKEAMKGLEIDTKKLPLGKLSKTQVLHGFEVLEKIEKKLNGEKMSESLQDLSSLFYTRVPHDFGRQRPPVISNQVVLQAKMDMLMVLADIEMAQTMQTEVKKEEAAELPHPLDEKYGTLKARLTSLKKSDPNYKVLETYMKSTQGYRKLEIQDVFEVDREEEGKRFSAHDGLKNRRLLWHGTNVAVVAAILKTGLRIMPHSGGRVGKGMYFASENSKSAGYVRCARNTGIMFLVEVALGEEHHISRDDWTLTKPPSGKDCIIAKGHTEPDPTKDTKITLGGKPVAVPQGPPQQQSMWSGSSFSQSEYLVYQESQARIRYMLKIKF